MKNKIVTEKNRNKKKTAAERNITLPNKKNHGSR